jgi:hypothetical protein
MDAAAIVSVSAAVVSLVQLAKWSGVPDSKGPIAVLALSFLGVAFWGWSVGTFERTQAFAYFAGWIAVATSSAGIFGFTRAGSDAMVKTTSPPSGAGAEPTRRIGD